MSERTIYIDSRCKISFSNDYVKIIQQEKVNNIHLNDFDTIIFSCIEISCSIYLLYKLSEYGKSVLFCNDKKYPQSLLLPIYGVQNSFERLTDQYSWSVSRKDSLWLQIVKNKITCQNETLFNCQRQYLPLLDVITGDKNNAEGRFANLYFKKLFGRKFRRYDSDNYNAALNYGYTILLTAMARIISTHGYSTVFGVHHSNKNNNYNFACDLIEPFRPIIDEIVFNHNKKKLDTQYKCELIQSLYKIISYNEKKYTVIYAMELFLLDVVAFMQNKTEKVGVIKFA